MEWSNQQKKGYFALGLALILWSVIFYQGFITALDVWIVSDIYNHCLFVLPCSIYFIYQKRRVIQQLPLKATFLPIIPLAGAIFVQQFALVGDIKILMHMATFSALPLLIWALVGHQIAKALLFPLFFILFCIPIGDQLIPHLQEITTDLAVPLLELTNVPVYRNGLYLDIPEGRFLVAEACSGISFLISSIVFGFLYAYISFGSLKKRAAFVVVAIAVPILANAFRVYGIVLTGHLSDMQYAVGADHLVYGGVFYTIILFILIIIGERFRDKSIHVVNDTQPIGSDEVQKYPYSILPITTFAILAVAQQLWLYSIHHVTKSNFSLPDNVTYSELTLTQQDNIYWQPAFKAVDREVIGVIDNTNIDAYVAYYNGTGAELISSSHRLYSDKQWSLIGHNNIKLDGKYVTLTELASQESQRRYLIHWYEINGKHFNSSSEAKLYQAYLMLLGQNASGVKIIVSTTKRDLTKQEFVNYGKTSLTKIRSTLYNALATQQ